MIPENPTYIRLEKVGNQRTGCSALDIGYWVKGKLIQKIEIGKMIMLERYIRNGEKVLGLFRTSTVKDIEKTIDGGLFIRTLNSDYRLEFLNEKEFLKEIEDITIFSEFPKENKNELN